MEILSCSRPKEHPKNQQLSEHPQTTARRCRRESRRRVTSIVLKTVVVKHRRYTRQPLAARGYRHRADPQRLLKQAGHVQHQADHYK